MANNQSDGPIQVIDNSVTSINDAFRQAGDRLDALKGLRGRAQIYDRVGVSDPTVSGDAVNLATLNSRITGLNPGRMVYATTAVYYVDADGQILNGFGAVPI